MANESHESDSTEIDRKLAGALGLPVAPEGEDFEPVTTLAKAVGLFYNELKIGASLNEEVALHLTSVWLAGITANKE